MKFTDGYWQTRPGVTPHYAAQVHEVTAEDDAITVYAPVGKLQDRGHTINQPLLTLRFSSPMENVIRVQCVHHKGKTSRKPEFTLYKGGAPRVSIENNELSATLTSGSLSVRVNKGSNWLVEYIAYAGGFSKPASRTPRCPEHFGGVSNSMRQRMVVGGTSYKYVPG